MIFEPFYNILNSLKTKNQKKEYIKQIFYKLNQDEMNSIAYEYINGYSIIYYCCQNNAISEFLKLVNISDIDKTYNGETLLDILLKYCSDYIIDILIKNNCMINNFDIVEQSIDNNNLISLDNKKKKINNIRYFYNDTFPIYFFNQFKRYVEFSKYTKFENKINNMSKTLALHLIRKKNILYLSGKTCGVPIFLKLLNLTENNLTQEDHKLIKNYSSYKIYNFFISSKVKRKQLLNCDIINYGIVDKLFLEFNSLESIFKNSVNNIDFSEESIEILFDSKYSSEYEKSNNTYLFIKNIDKMKINKKIFDEMLKNGYLYKEWNKFTTKEELNQYYNSLLNIDFFESDEFFIIDTNKYIYDIRNYTWDIPNKIYYLVEVFKNMNILNIEIEDKKDLQKLFKLLLKDLKIKENKNKEQIVFNYLLDNKDYFKNYGITIGKNKHRKIYWLPNND